MIRLYGWLLVKQPHHLTVEFFQLVRLLRSSFNGLQGTFHSVQSVLAVRLLEHNLTEEEEEKKHN